MSNVILTASLAAEIQGLRARALDARRADVLDACNQALRGDLGEILNLADALAAYRAGDVDAFLAR
jgi:hypothetical protein